jgi:hypothetical protein
LWRERISKLKDVKDQVPAFPGIAQTLAIYLLSHTVDLAAFTMACCRLNGVVRVVSIAL